MGNGVATAVARPQGRGPGRSQAPPADGAGVAEARGRVNVQNGAAHSGAKVDGRSSRSSGMATDRGRAFCTPINWGRKRGTGDVDDDDDVEYNGDDDDAAAE